MSSLRQLVKALWSKPKKPEIPTQESQAPEPSPLAKSPTQVHGEAAVSLGLKFLKEKNVLTIARGEEEYVLYGDKLEDLADGMVQIIDKLYPGAELPLEDFKTALVSVQSDNELSYILYALNKGMKNELACKEFDLWILKHKRKKQACKLSDLVDQTRTRN